MATDEDERELRMAVMRADLDLKTKQSFWETPKGIAAVIAATAVVVGTLAGLAGFNLGRTPPASLIQLPPGTTLTVPPAPSPPR